MKQFCVILIALILLSCNNRRKPSTYEILKATSQKLNQTLPRQIDSITTLETTVAIQEDRFRYILYLKIDTADYDLAEIERSTREGNINWIKSNPEFKPLRDLRITLEYSYSDWNSIHLFTVTIKPEDYE
ncbi:hypothetical protein LZZ85_05515 [Terrimonas sp. NA20]|uniref:Lipoprotein n=1 Tax=Terrimonas ginsenosidimutans TaxID=2908004 RepID=A0ABS9KN59_9BACT|nr:hypothetical protein [Terrimonas ginsenosidimutans]MCG2613725.1 hypothetical protein [Terrimonas ginsenosidimutans]